MCEHTARMSLIYPRHDFWLGRVDAGLHPGRLNSSSHVIDFRLNAPRYRKRGRHSLTIRPSERKPHVDSEETRDCERECWNS
jgi:hypothetical protein